MTIATVLLLLAAGCHQPQPATAAPAPTPAPTPAHRIEPAAPAVTGSSPVVTAQEAKPSGLANAPIAPLTADERTMLGRWGVDINGILQIAREKPEELGLPVGASEEETAKQLLLMLPFFKSMVLELKDDRRAVFIGAGALLEGTWKVDAGQVALDGPTELKGLALRREGAKTAFGGPGMNSKGVPAKLMPRGTAVTAAEIAGEWSVDIDASVKATRLYWLEVFAIMPAALKEIQELFFQGLPQKLEDAGMQLRFEADKATFATQGAKPKETVVTVMGDMVLLRAPGGLKEAAADAPELVAPIFTDGKMLAMNISSFVAVFARTPAKKQEQPK